MKSGERDGGLRVTSWLAGLKVGLRKIRGLFSWHGHGKDEVQIVVGSYVNRFAPIPIPFPSLRIHDLYGT